MQKCENFVWNLRFFVRFVGNYDKNLSLRWSETIRGNIFFAIIARLAKGKSWQSKQT